MLLLERTLDLDIILTWRKTSSEILLVVMLTLEIFPNMVEPSFTEPPETPIRCDSDPDTEDLHRFRINLQKPTKRTW